MSRLVWFQLQWGSEYQPFECLTHLKTKLFEVRISNGLVYSNGRSMGYVLCTRPSIIILDQNIENKISAHLSGIQMAFKTGPFGIKPLIDYSNTKLVPYSDPHCIRLKDTLVIQIPTVDLNGEKKNVASPVLIRGECTRRVERAQRWTRTEQHPPKT